MMSGLMWCSSEEWQTTKTALQELEGLCHQVFVGRCCDLEYWVLS